MTLIHFSFTDMCFNRRSELSSKGKPHRPLPSSNCRRCVTVCGYQKRSNENILCATCYYRLPSTFMRTSYNFMHIHYTTKLEYKFTNCSNCFHNLTTITPPAECYLCLQLDTAINSLRKFYHE